MNQQELKLFDTCDMAKQNLRELVGFSLRAEALNRFLLKLNKAQLRESLVYAFVQLPGSVIERYSEMVKPEDVMEIKHLGEKYDDEGLSRKEQIELFQLHQKLNKQILDELQRKQDDFERILKTSGSNLDLME